MTKNILLVLLTALSFNIYCGYDYNDFDRSINDGKVNEIKRLIAQGADVNDKGHRGYRPIHLAAMSGNAEIIKLLLNAGADINAKTDAGSTPLHEVAELSQVSAPSKLKPVLELLLKSGADKNIEDKSGRTAAYIAQEHRKPQVADTINNYQPQAQAQNQ